MSSSVIASTAKKIRAFNPSKFNTLAGLDGFVDNIIDVVDKRADAMQYTRVETIGRWAIGSARAAGLSSNLELVVRQQKLGGNGPIMANALIENGLNVSYIGCLGFPFPMLFSRRWRQAQQSLLHAVRTGRDRRAGISRRQMMLGKHQTLKEVTTHGC